MQRQILPGDHDQWRLMVIGLINGDSLTAQRAHGWQWSTQMGGRHCRAPDLQAFSPARCSSRSGQYAQTPGAVWRDAAGVAATEMRARISAVNGDHSAAALGQRHDR